MMPRGKSSFRGFNCKVQCCCATLRGQEHFIHGQLRRGPARGRFSSTSALQQSPFRHCYPAFPEPIHSGYDVPSPRRRYLVPNGEQRLRHGVEEMMVARRADAFTRASGTDRRHSISTTYDERVHFNRIYFPSFQTQLVSVKHHYAPFHLQLHLVRRQLNLRSRRLLSACAAAPASSNAARLPHASASLR